ncbi:cyanophycinase [Streptomyces sp. NPDC006733]|uniref:cyanophycinase n=1 Tax=Streptomyces sp. NPDC006733 TaxID=3155460 RepID=UPI0033CA192A
MASPARTPRPHRYRPALSRAAVLAAALAVVAATGPLAAAHSDRHPQQPGGTLILVGGGLKEANAEIYHEIINKAGGGGHARIGVLTGASVPPSQDPAAGDPATCSNSECNGAYYAGLFTSYGAADAQWIPIDLDHLANADADQVVAQVNSMTGFFFGGGDQYRYLTTMLHGAAHTDSKVLAAIRTKLAAGAVVSGSSAGAQIAAGPDMVTGGDSYQALRDGSAPGYFDDPAKLGYVPAGGFGFLSTGLLDTHTGTYGREGRAIRLAADTGQERVFALDENTALEVEHAGTRRQSLHVLGEHGVSVLDLRHARTTRTAGAGWSVRDVRYSYLTAGDGYDADRWTVLPSPAKAALHPAATGPVPANHDVFASAANDRAAPYSFVGTAHALLATTRRTATATTFESGPTFRVDFTRTARTRSWSADGTTATSFQDLTVAIGPQ